MKAMKTREKFLKSLLILLTLVITITIVHEGGYARNTTNKDYKYYTINIKTENSKTLESHIKESAQEFNVRPELIESIIKHESNYNQNVKSHVGAIGLMQLMPATAQELGVNPHSAKDNVKGGTKYIKNLMELFDDDIDLVLASYNAGMGNVWKYKGIPPFKETQNYVRNVRSYYQKLLAKTSINAEQHRNLQVKWKDEMIK